MALHFISFKPPFCTTKAQVSPTTSPVKLSSLPAANKWNIAEENQSIPWTSLDDLHIKHAEKLKVLKHVLRNVGDKHSSKGIHMIDALQRLNMDHHFQEEIDTFLKRQYVISGFNGIGGGYDYGLHETALRFRLLRQQGYYVPAGSKVYSLETWADVYEKFTDKDGKFNQKLGEDVKGMMDLYEASQPSIEGEDILDEAGQFSGKVLKEKVANLDLHESKFIRSTLEQTFHKSLAMFTSRNLLKDSYHMNGSEWFSALQDVAKMDLSLVQRIHKKEVLQISKWWMDVGLANELKYARNQPLKWYIWSLACLPDPSLSEQRIELTKPISFIYLIDDIFDVYGTLHELTLFTEAVTRWDINAEKLPDYMKICFKALYDLTNEISYKVYQKNGWNPIDYLRKTWASLCKAFLVEVEWFASGKLPKAEEYLKNGIVSSGVRIVLVHIFFLLGVGITKENVKIIDRLPAVVSSSATILRLWDDLGSAEDESQQGNDGSYVEYLLKEHEDWTFQCKRAREQVMRKISDAWKNFNKECLFQKKNNNDSFAASFLKASLNLARMVPLMYSYDDKHCLPRLEEQVKSLLYDDVLIM